MLADDAVADVDVNTGKRHLLARDKDLKLEDGSLDSKADTTIVVPDARPHATGSHDIGFNSDSSDSISSASADPVNNIPSHDSISSSDVDAKAKFNGTSHEHYGTREMILYGYRFYFMQRTRSQTQAIIDRIEKKGRNADNDELKRQAGYIGFLDQKCALPRERNALACA